MIGRLEELLVGVRRQVLDLYLTIHRVDRMREQDVWGQDRVNKSVAARLDAIEQHLGVTRP